MLQVINSQSIICPTRIATLALATVALQNNAVVIVRFRRVCRNKRTFIKQNARAFSLNAIADVPAASVTK